MSLPGAALLFAVLAAVMSGTAFAHGAVPSGDTCTAVGQGTSYTVNVNVASTGSHQYGFALGASGGAVQGITVTEIEGSFLTSGLPSGSTGTWITTSPLSSGSVGLSVITSAPVTSFSVRPAAAASPATYLDPIQCAVTPAPTPTATLTVDRHAAYDAAAKAWRLTVTIGRGGVVSAKQPEPTVGTGGSKSTTPTPLVQARRIALKTAGKVTLTLRPTSRGESMLAKSGSIRAKLAVTYFPTGGKAATRVVSLVLTK
jgi:hypothetical protein